MDENKNIPALPFHDKEEGAFPYSKEQNATRENLGKAIAKLLTPQTLYALGAHVVMARDKGTEAQQKRWARNGRTTMCEVSIPIPALSFDLEGSDDKVITKPLVLNLAAVIDVNANSSKDETAAAPTGPRALTLDALRQMQNAGREAAKNALKPTDKQ